ncbi:hypothetical protein [Exiguobacterium algae]|uniref:hypothetical protein n=1 Tax=Exiguobacterium algae TaxID=2751250 RepID=UPI001BE97C34|nr:hypothetical protein [Exiguobacterium algae]
MKHHQWIKRILKKGRELFSNQGSENEATCSGQGDAPSSQQNAIQQVDVETLHVFTLEDTKPETAIEEASPKEREMRVYSNGWRKSYDDPERVIRAFSRLRVKEEFKLEAYQFVEGDNGNGVVWAIPAEQSLPEPEACERLTEYFLSPPKPRVALDDFMEAIEGDASPLSYLQAAIAYHELHEFGAMWHGVSWWEFEILTSDNTYEWEFTEGYSMPDLMDPHFYYNSAGKPVVVFHTLNPIGSASLSRYEHTFESNRYGMKCERIELGYAKNARIMIF